MKRWYGLFISPAAIVVAVDVVAICCFCVCAKQKQNEDDTVRNYSETDNIPKARLSKYGIDKIHKYFTYCE